MERVQVDVRRGPMEAIARDVGLHEAPILAAIYGGSNLVEVKRYKDDAKVDPAAEFARLTRKYGEHPKAGVPWVEYVYGRFDRFQQAFKKAA